MMLSSWTWHHNISLHWSNRNLQIGGSKSVDPGIPGYGPRNPCSGTTQIPDICPHTHGGLIDPHTDWQQKATQYADGSILWHILSQWSPKPDSGINRGVPASLRIIFLHGQHGGTIIVWWWDVVILLWYHGGMLFSAREVSSPHRSLSITLSDSLLTNTLLSATSPDD